MKDFRCSHCKQLQFKYKLEGEVVIVEVKCYACNHFSTFTIHLNRAIGNDTIAACSAEIT